MASPALPLSDVVNVTVQVAPQLPATPTFNQGLVVGTSNIIPAAERLRQYSSLAQILTDGFSLTSPEYLAASLYFGQSPAAQFLWLGRQDLTAIATIILHAGAGGTGYVVGDILGVVQGGASGGTVRVTTVSGGVITGLALVTPGTGYAIGASLVTSGGSGTGALVDVTGIGDTALQAVTACRAKSSSWWGVLVTGAADADHTAIAAFVEATTPFSYYFFTTGEAAVLANTAGNIVATLKALEYKRTLAMYSTTQSGLFPNNIYAAAAVMGMAMGLNTGLANSFFTFKFKTLVGVGLEPLTDSQKNTLEGINCNTYVGYQNAYVWLEQGVSVNGQFADEILNLDMLASGIQFGVANVLISSPAIPLTNPGQTLLINAVNQACQAARVRGFISPGVWKGVQILDLLPGDPLSAGYLSQSPSFATQSPADRAARKAMPIYTTIIESGAAHSVAIAVIVQR
jgi:hypothetical protein